MIEINSVNNPTIKSLRKLEQKKYRKKTQTYLIEGFHLVEEALKNHENYLYVLGTAEALKKLDASYKLKDDKVIQITDAISQHLSRSEEHTSELQSRFDLVCRLLLEKKKKSIVKVVIYP